MNWSIIIFCLAAGLLPLFLFAKAQYGPLMLAKTAETSHIFQHESGYWLSEKYDGVRAFWDGNKLFTRQLNEIHAPYWFTAQFPATPLDGELWIQRSSFDLVSSIVRKHKPINIEWQEVKFMVFDTPNRHLNFEQRQSVLKGLLKQNPIPWLKQVKQLYVDTEQQFENIYNQIVNAGGEGVMLSKSKNHYVPGRTDELLKVKPFQDDEGIVVKYLPGKGRLSGMVGAIVVKTKAGDLVRLGSGLEDHERQNPPKLGAIVTFRYSGLTSKGKPRFPRFYRVRTDLSSL